MLAMFGAGIVIAMYLTGGIGDGVGLFEDADGDPIADATDGDVAAGEASEDLFVDDDDSGVERAIELAVRSGAMSGCGEDADRTFCPEDPITRAAFAVALDVVVEVPEGTTVFDDVDPDAPYAGAVGRLAAGGIIRGCDDNLFCPDDRVTRAQGAALVARTIELPAEPVRRFDDVPADSVFADVLGRMAAQGVILECVEVPARICPDDPLTRAEAAAILARAGLLG